MPRLLHRKRRGVTPLAATRISAEETTGRANALGARIRLNVIGSRGGACADVPRAEEGRVGAGAASAAGEVLAAVWDLPPLGGHEGAATELREELFRLATVAVELRRKEEQLDRRLKQIERLEKEHEALAEQKPNKKDDHPPSRNQLQEQLKTALSKIDKLTKDLNKITELEDDLKAQIVHLETLAKNREQAEKEHRLNLESIDLERKEWREREEEYLKKIEELRNHKAAEEYMRTEISQLQNDYNARGEAITELESKVVSLQVSNDALNETVRNLHDKIDDLEQQCDELRAQIEHIERSDEEVHVLTKKVENLLNRDRQSENVILELRQAICHLEAVVTENSEVNASLSVRVQTAEMEALGAAALRERLIELLDGVATQDGLQSDDDIVTAVTNVFNKFKMEEEQCQQRIEQLQERVNELESGKHQLHYDNSAKTMIDSLQEKLAQSQGAEQEARAMLEELQAKLRYLEAVECQDKDMLLNFQGKGQFPENMDQVADVYQLEPPPEPTLFHHPLELQHPFLQQHLHPNQFQFHVPYPQEFAFQVHPRKDVPSRHHLPSLQPMEQFHTTQPLPLEAPLQTPQPQLSKGAKKKQRQCFKCQKFGHLAKQCSGETTCVVCGVKGHTHNECNTNEARCANCQGPHRASSKTCPVRLNWCANAVREDDTQFAPS